MCKVINEDKWDENKKYRQVVGPREPIMFGWRILECIILSLVDIG